MSSSPTDAERQSASSVLDASALLAVILSEPGADVVRQFVRRGAAVGTVNLAEVVSRLVELGMTSEVAQDEVEALSVTYRDFSPLTAWSSGLLRSATRHLGLSLGDRACLALAAELGLPAVTADRNWSQLDLGVQIDVIR